jgi:hypothetical protein
VEAFMSAGKTRRQEEAEIEETTATCMRAAGWRYEPTAKLFTGDLATVGDLRNYRAQSGYGLAPTKLILSAERDTNGDYLASLPPERRKAYLVSLHGSSTPGDESGALVLPREDAKGCRHRAERRVRLGMPRHDERLQQYRRAARLSHHPALRSALSAWSSCMRGRGFAYSMPPEVVRDLSQLWTQGGADGDEETRQALLQRELEVARADVDCYVTTVHPVQRVLERALLDRIAAAFPQYAAVLTSK